jgi:hypothetical protein
MQLFLAGVVPPGRLVEGSAAASRMDGPSVIAAARPAVSQITEAVELFAEDAREQSSKV